LANSFGQQGEKQMRDNVKELAAIAATTLPIMEPVYEFGALQVAGQEGFADLRPLFPGKQFVGVDMREGLGVDRILNLHDIDLPPESVGTIISLDTLEHVEYPGRALQEIHRVLKPDGIAIISSVMYFPIHDHPYDYWRFTPEAFKSILKPFAHSFVGYAGKEKFPHTVIGIGFKGAVPDLAEFTRRYNAWQQQQEEIEEPPGFKHVVKLLTPPILHPLLSRLYTALSGLIR
jgi:SAM-dependent methyltransferase